ncbi:oxidoreductase [Talaromyces proteolyticus]|uniref:Oxidoreductase n=1 Tax=Talaromyces proteolyticus TaxID=1131652 RepID=A0AAD4KD80_9EURO|nr:oxidoreductase [Talaromyces proteolyticus]KAH8689346.1 oxidoreductase [Talaromyces proteolyticus]
MVQGFTYMKGVALVTGAASGIGRAIAHTFVKEGCTRLVIGDVNKKDLDIVSEELRAINSSVQTVVSKVDVSSETEVQDFVDAGVKAFGGIHYAVNNVGITSNPRARTHELETSSFDPLVAVNLRGTWLCQRAEIRQMLKQNTELRPRTGAPAQRGAIVNVSSLFGLMSFPNSGGYSATKAGVLGMTRTDAISYATDGIRVNSVLPGWVKTPTSTESERRGANYTPVINTIPVKRWGIPEEIAEACVFLAGEKASLITGVDLVVDGGKRVATWVD